MGEWEGGDRANLGPSGAIAAVEYAVERFTDLGIRLPPGNRLELSRLLLRRVNAGEIVLNPNDTTSLRRVAEAQWTAFDFYLIARATGAGVSSDYSEKLLLALGGSDLPEIDTNHIHRNTAFELVVAAVLTMGGILVTLDEPDIRIVLNDEVLGVAAKRVQGAGALQKRTAHAAKQIRASGLRGFIAVNADVILLGTQPIGSAIEKGETVDEKIAVLHKLDDKLIHDEALVGRIVFGRTARWDFEEADKPVLQMDMFRQYRVYERPGEDVDELQHALDVAEDTIDRRMSAL